MPEAKVSGKRGNFSPNETKTVDKAAQKRSAPPPPANEGKQRVSQDLVHSLEAKIITDKGGDKVKAPQNMVPGASGTQGQPSPVKNIARRRAPPPPKSKKEMVDETDFGPEASISPGTPKHLTTQTKQPIPGSPVKRPAPGIPPAAKQQAAKNHSPSTVQQPPPSPNKNSTDDNSDLTTAKKRRPAPTRPPPQRNLETGKKTFQ